MLLLGEASEWCRLHKKNARGGGKTLALRNCERPKQEMRSETMEGGNRFRVEEV